MWILPQNLQSYYQQLTCSNKPSLSPSLIPSDNYHANNIKVIFRQNIKIIVNFKNNYRKPKPIYQHKKQNIKATQKEILKKI